jgi:predicted RNA binding protein YcfA (HicA-like mRNA interferase family)
MGSKYPVLKPTEIITILNKFGFSFVSQKGSHIKMRKVSDDQLTKTVIIPNHYEVSKGTLQAILEQAGITIEEFIKMK